MCGDSLQDTDTLMGETIADMIFTDPPYNVDYGSSKNPPHKIRSIENDSLSDDDWASFNSHLAQTMSARCSGDVYIFGASGPDGMRARLAYVDAGFHWSATIIWKKQQLVLSPAKYQRIYEPCFYGWHENGKSSFVGDRKQVELWEIDRPHNSKEHPTMKPIELCAKGILNSSKKDDIVLDLFLGSGSTLIACEQTDRTCYGMELDEKYLDVIRKRYWKFVNNNDETGWEDNTPLITG
jgi:DNA modification methylase